MSKLRNTKIGFVFQFHELIPELNVMENICLPGWIKNDNKVVDNANSLISYFGLDKLKNKKPNTLSGGEKQRANSSSDDNNQRLFLLMNLQVILIQQIQRFY